MIQTRKKFKIENDSSSKIVQIQKMTRFENKINVVRFTNSLFKKHKF
jgi:hypothetical protein